MNILRVFCFALLLVVAFARRGCRSLRDRTFTDTARTAAGLFSEVRSFQRVLGGPVNGMTPGPLRGGRREINWDGAPVPFDLPGDFFNRVSPRGLIMNTRGEEFRVSNPPGLPNDDRFDSLIPRRISTMFRTFSSPRLFSPFSSNRMTVSFRVPGGTRRASTSGFGAVFVDVDERMTTYMDFFGRDNCLIRRVYVPPSSSGLSFAGLTTRRGRRRASGIYRVEINLGSVGLQDFSNRFRGRYIGDLVFMDDFFYGEPRGL